MLRRALLLLPVLLLACLPGLPPAPGAPREGFRLPALHAEPDPVRGGRIVDALGREVILRGVNVNAFVEYWAHTPSLFTTYPLVEEDVDRMAAMGFDLVRLLLSWSRVEPEPGVYDEAYLDEIEAAIRLLESRGIYTLVDLHQDAWGPTLAGDPDAECPGSEPAFGWDGAPGWATQDDGAARCQRGGARELTAAVLAAFAHFWADDAGPGGVGIRTRYVAMLGHVAERLSKHDAVMGYDVMNEPNAYWLIPGQLEALSDLYADALVAIRAGEAAAGAPPRLLVFEPGITWADFGAGAPPPFPHDGQVVYAPHIYQGGINPLPLGPAPFAQARSEANTLYGGAPVLTGEWGGDPGRAADPNGYFEVHQRLQDEFRIGATLWTWREACGDPHKAGDFRHGRVARVWGFYEVDCTTNATTGLRHDLVRAMTRPLLRAAPGAIDTLEVDGPAGTLEASGSAAAPLQSFIAFVPSSSGEKPRIAGEGIASWLVQPAPGGWYVAGQAQGGAWRISLVSR